MLAQIRQRTCPGNAYAGCVQTQNETFRVHSIKRLLVEAAPEEYVVGPAARNLKRPGNTMRPCGRLRHGEKQPGGGGQPEEKWFLGSPAMPSTTSPWWHPYRGNVV